MNELELLLTVDTPENIDFNYEIAGLGSRFLAAAIDTLVVSVIQAILILTMLIIAGFDFAEAALGMIIAGITLVAFGVLWGYYILFELVWRGQSPGKRALKIRVVRTDGSAITLTESIIRNLIRIVDFLPAFYGLGVVTMFVNENARRLGDLAARTLVVYEHEQVGLDSLAWDSTRRRVTEIEITEALDDANVADLPLELLTEADLSLIEDFLRRRHDISIAVSLSKRMVDIVEKRLEIPVAVRTLPYDQRVQWLNRIVVAARNHPYQ